VRNVGSDFYGDVALMQSIDEGFNAGPRIIPATHLIGATGGHCDETYLPPSLNASEPSVIDSPDAGRHMVRLLHKYGAQVIKICATGGVFSHGDTPGAQQLTLEEIKAIVDEAHRTGLKVAAHAHGADGIKAAIRAGVRTVDHGSYLDDEAVAMLKENRRTYYVPTLALGAYMEESAHVPESEKARGRIVNEIAVRGFKRALVANLPIGLATDAPVMPHGLTAREIEYRVSLGEPAMHAIVAATSLNAEILNMQDRIGSVAAGKLADLIAVAGNPLTTIGVLRDVRFVMKAGVVFKDDVSARPGR
jgi:imidazolonepropionase-like amidohydrolase